MYCTNNFFDCIEFQMDNVYSQIADRRKRKAPSKQANTHQSNNQSESQSDDIPFLHADIDLLLKRADLLNQTINGPTNQPFPQSQQSISHSSRQSPTGQSNSQSINSLIAPSTGQPTLFKPLPLDCKPEPQFPVPMNQYISLLVNQPHNQAQTPAHAQQYATYYEYAVRLKGTVISLTGQTINESTNQMINISQHNQQVIRSTSVD